MYATVPATSRGSDDGLRLRPVMRAWFKTTLQGFHGLREPRYVPTQRLQFGIEDVREEMLRLLEDLPAREVSRAALRLRIAMDAQALWFLRADLLGTLSKHHGEQEACRRIQRVTALLEALIPPGLRARPSPLA